MDQSQYRHIALDKSIDDETGTSIRPDVRINSKQWISHLNRLGRCYVNFLFKFYKSDQLMEEGDADFKRDKREISQVLNTEAMAFGHSQDSIEKVATPTGGIDLLYNFVWQQLSAACGIPKSVLTGEQAGTLAGASQDVINYYDSIKAIQTNLLKPEIEQITRILMYANGDDPDQLDWKIVFNDLQTMDDKNKLRNLHEPS
ncbi:anti-CBASS protein Acb1 family protein [Lactobacillus crispatus]|uniref:anti-CBASS protein Acb1 family protein n=1 Tax=Lactobacillus crispatus TaxID=47770 RepID=UPI003369D7FA